MQIIQRMETIERSKLQLMQNQTFQRPNNPQKGIHWPCEENEEKDGKSVAKCKAVSKNLLINQ